MNILVSDSWLKEHLKTKATPKKIAEYLSLCSQSVEKITKVGNDWVYEIEVTTNRPDCFSVYGIARELAAILPRFGIKAKLEQVTSYKLQVTSKNGLPLEVKITDPSLCPRFTAIIFDNIKVGPSPKIIQDRLEKAGIRSLNNIVDISNYLMLELGQPMHTFDYDKIKGAKMILRESIAGEKITTLDGQTRILPAGAIVIKDGQGRIIDLCGIMGAENSAVDEKTKRVLLFVQTYDPARIRRTCQQLGFRTEAASRFEKGVDPEGVIIAMEKAIAMFEKNCSARVAGKLIDIYPSPPKPKIIKLDFNLINRIIGLEIPQKEVIDILKSLGFGLLQVTGYRLQVTVPHWRYNDISIPEDLIEEIARIYGYHRLPSNLPPASIPGIERPKFRELRFFWEEKIKIALKYWGFTEIATYSMVSSDLLTKVGFDPQDYLKIANPLTQDLVYMRPSLSPSILQIISQNQASSSDIRIFEIANIYIPQGEKNLPEEIPVLTAGLTSDRFYEAKGILEALFEDLGIKNYQFKKGLSVNKIFCPGKMAEVLIGGKPVGILGEIDTAIAHYFDIAGRVVLFDLEVNSLISRATQVKKYTPIPSFPPIIEDLAFVIFQKVETAKIIEAIKSV
ncbi:phenylalanine--tRNA ligase subunit beta, partial [Candidatus Gottesmanbacteria bacterium]|nr:phenylalanine--tRNA ligase subunit beta [Candidatus Gottesmanbacteria bacterium]